jgi:hypothetical protein
VAADVPVEDRIATFDADGTLWCEKPVPIEVDFILRRLVTMTQADPSLRDRQPWKAAYSRDGGWFGKVINNHFAGDDTDIPTVLGGFTSTYAGIGVEEFEALADSFLRSGRGT